MTNFRIKCSHREYWWTGKMQESWSASFQKNNSIVRTCQESKIFRKHILCIRSTIHSWYNKSTLVFPAISVFAIYTQFLLLFHFLSSTSHVHVHKQDIGVEHICLFRYTLLPKRTENASAPRCNHTAVFIKSCILSHSSSILALSLLHSVEGSLQYGFRMYYSPWKLLCWDCWYEKDLNIRSWLCLVGSAENNWEIGLIYWSLPGSFVNGIILEYYWNSKNILWFNWIAIQFEVYCLIEWEFWCKHLIYLIIALIFLLV